MRNCKVRQLGYQNIDRPLFFPILHIFLFDNKLTLQQLINKQIYVQSTPIRKIRNRFSTLAKKRIRLFSIADQAQEQNVVQAADRFAMTENYKERVRDFLVKMASKPLQLGQYIPPVKNIMRQNDQSRNLANAQLYINGFKTNKERLERAVSENKILDYTPIPVCALNHEFRSRLMNKEIQPGMRFQGENSPKAKQLTSSRASSKLPPISVQNPEAKLYFKGVEQMGNKLKSMEQKQSDRIGLINKLQTVYGGGDINLQRTSLEILENCKLNKSKTVKTLRSVSLMTEKST